MFASISGELFSYGLIGLPVVLLLFAVQYIALRIRDTRANPPDPHLGRKAILYLFFNAAVFLALVGFTISALDWSEYLFDPLIAGQQARQAGQPPLIDPATGQPLPLPAREWFNDQQRLAAGLVASGLLHAILFWVIVRLATNDREFPAVRRAFAATRLGVAGLVVMTTSTVSLVMAFQKGETDYQTLQMVCGVAAVWGPVALVHLVLVLWSSGWRRKAAP
jgi:hypothetical protein